MMAGTDRQILYLEIIKAPIALEGENPHEVFEGDSVRLYCITPKLMNV